MRHTERLFPIVLIIALLLAGCRSQPAPPQTSSSPETSPSSNSGEAHAQPPQTGHRSQKLVSDAMTAGARGLQPVTFVITSAEKPVEAATLSIQSATGKPVGSGRSNDWGEFKTSLSPGRYTVLIHWEGAPATRTISIDAATQEIPLSLTPPKS